MTTGQAVIRPLVAGNWKMNGVKASLAEARTLKSRISATSACDVMICPPATLISPLAAEMSGGRVLVGGQDCHAKASGAHTGDVSTEMLRDAGATAVIVGHSERRADHGECDADVAAKAQAAHRAGLIAIICVGETAAERKDGRTLARGGAAARRLGASGRYGCQHRRCLRAGLGNRYGSDADGARCRRRARRHACGLGETVWCGRQQAAFALRRIGEAAECARIDGHCAR